MDVTIVASPAAKHQTAHQEALAKGFEAHGLRATKAHTFHRLQTQVVACWGWRIGKLLESAGHSVLVMERGYLGDRFAWTSLGWNGLNNRSTVKHIPDDASRFSANYRLQPDNPAGRYTLIIGQVPGDQSLQGRDLYPWYVEQAAKAEGEVIFRPHPLAHKRGPVRSVRGAMTHSGSLAEALSGARKVVTFNSNAGVDAAIAGKPVTVEDRGSMAWDYAQGMDRQQWANRLAWRQWSLAEIESGYALEYAGVTDGR